MCTCTCQCDLAWQCDDSGHSSHVTNVRFLDNDNYFISVGGNDKCVFQWRITWNDADEEVKCFV